MKNKICAITPTRGDRPQFDDHCRYLIERQTVKVDKHIFIDYTPLSDKPDLTQRIRTGVQIAKDLGYERAYIIENDDYYPAGYIEKIESLWLDEKLEFIDLFGSYKTIYFYLKTKQFWLESHKGRASLFTTSFKIDSLLNFNWPSDETVFLDLELCKSTLNKAFFNFDNMPIGIKHGIGLCAGSGHSENFPYNNGDPSLSFFNCWITDKRSRNFYKSFMQ